MPGITFEDIVPNLEVEITHGKVKLHDYYNNGWTIIFSHPADFTSVCTTELGKMVAFQPEFEKCEKRIKLSLVYPATTGRNMDEALRAQDALQKVSKYKIATLVNWKPDDIVVISPAVTNEEAKKMFPQGFETKKLPSGLEYLRFTRV